MLEIREYIDEFCEYFGTDLEKILNSAFTVVTPDNNNPFKQMYVAN